MVSPENLLRAALDEARRGRGLCAPNPAVGAVLVQKDFIVSKGYHHGAGLPHAEVEALADVREDLSQATLYVTLEPCCHQGRTPPCTRFLIERGIKKVVYGHQDPNPVVAGKGEAELRAAGVEVTHLPLPEVERFYRSYDHWTRTGRPFVTAKLALSLDGKI